MQFQNAGEPQRVGILRRHELSRPDAPKWIRINPMLINASDDVVQFEGYTAVVSDIEWGFIQYYALIPNGGPPPVPTTGELIDVARRQRWRVVRARAVYPNNPAANQTLAIHLETSISPAGR